MEDKVFDRPFDNVFKTSKKVFQELGIEIEHADYKHKTITGQTGTTLFSWGENVQIILQPITEAKTKVIIESTSSVQLIDWGTNKKNEQRILTALNRLLK